MQRRLLDLLPGVAIHPLTDEVRTLARTYVERGVFAPIMLNDALHVSAAIMTRQDVLISWNFRHLVNRRRRALVNEVNVSLGLPTIEILAPPGV